MGEEERELERQAAENPSSSYSSDDDSEDGSGGNDSERAAASEESWQRRERRTAMGEESGSDDGYQYPCEGGFPDQGRAEYHGPRYIHGPSGLRDRFEGCGTEYNESDIYE